jgi:hypothetical protein
MTKQEKILRKHIKSLLKQSNAAMLKNIDKVIASGAVDVTAYDTQVNPMILPKAITIALLQSEANQYDAKGTAYEKVIKREVNNLKHFI